MLTAVAPDALAPQLHPHLDAWYNVLQWLQEDPGASALALLGRLQQWRDIVANKLVYAVSETALRTQAECRKWRWWRAIQSAKVFGSIFR